MVPANGVEIELAKESAAQRARQAEMRRFTTLGRAWDGVKRAAGKDHNTLRLTCVLLVLFTSLFGSIILVIVSPDPPYSKEPLFTHSDMVKFMAELREKALREVPPQHPSKWSPQANSTWFGGVEREIRQLLDQWWPVAHAQFESADVLINDNNFFGANYSIFQHTFASFNLLSNILLFAIWLSFITMKEVRRLKLSESPWRNCQNPPNGAESGRQSRTAGQVLKNFYNSVLTRIKRLFWWAPLVYKEWFDAHHEQGPLWERTNFFVTFMLCILHILIEFFLLRRSSFFALILHQVSFVVLSILCLASTHIDFDAEDEEESPRVFVRNEPKSLRGTFFESHPSAPPVRSQETAVWTVAGAHPQLNSSPPKLFNLRTSRVTPIVEEEIPEQVSEIEAEMGSMTRSISETFQSPIETSELHDPYPSESNPFSDDDDEEVEGEEEKKNKEYSLKCLEKELVKENETPQPTEEKPTMIERTKFGSMKRAIVL